MARTKIVLRGNPHVNEQSVAGGAITPGMFVEGPESALVAAAGANELFPVRRMALERDEMGSEISVAYASGDAVKVASLRPGDRVYALVASGVSAIADDANIGMNGDGGVKTWASGAYQARSLEAVDNSAGAAGVPFGRIRIEIL